MESRVGAWKGGGVTLRSGLRKGAIRLKEMLDISPYCPAYYITAGFAQ